MEVAELLREGRTIWGSNKMPLPEIIVALGVIYGDLCRWERNAKKDGRTHTTEELQKELGNILFSTIRWCDDLGYDPEQCIALAIESQKKFNSLN